MEQLNYNLLFRWLVGLFSPLRISGALILLQMLWALRDSSGSIHNAVAPDEQQRSFSGEGRDARSDLFILRGIPALGLAQSVEDLAVE